MATIPASAIVQGNPGVIGTGGNALSLNGVFLSQNTTLPAQGYQSFASASAVGAYFGTGSQEYSIATIYFLGYDNSQVKPGAILFAPYAAAARSAFLNSGSLATMTLTQLQALSGVITLTVDGTPFTSSSINLSSAASFTAAATLIAAGFTGAGKPTVTWNAVNSVFQFTSSTTGATSTITYATGTLSTGLLLTSATGAILSQGVVADTPATAMNRLIAATQNWVTFTTLWEPLIADKTNFSVWTNSQNQRYAYIAWDTDAQAIVNGSTTCFGYVATQAAYNGVMPVYNNAALAAMIMGSFASVDFTRLNGRMSIGGKGQSGFTPTVTDYQTSVNLLANGYSFYGAYATAATNFNFVSNGQITGQWKWIDSYIDQIYLNSQFQLALITLYNASRTIPYNAAGYASIRAALNDPINAGVNAGIIRSGVSLSNAQISQINSSAGVDAATVIGNTGWFLQVLDPGTQARGNRQTPIINFWYTDGQSVQNFSMASVAVL